MRETDFVLRGLTIDQKPLKDHMEAIGHKEAFDEYHVNHNLDAMEKLFAGYVNTRLDSYLAMLEE